MIRHYDAKSDQARPGHGHPLRLRLLGTLLAVAVAGPLHAGVTTIDLQFLGTDPADDAAAFQSGSGDQAESIQLGRFPTDLFGTPAIAIGIGNDDGEVGGQVHTGPVPGQLDAQITFESTLIRTADPTQVAVSNIGLTLVDFGSAVPNDLLAAFNFLVQVGGQDQVAHSASLLGRNGSFEVAKDEGDLVSKSLIISERGARADLQFSNATFALDLSSVAIGESIDLYYEINFIALAVGGETFADISFFDPITGGSLALTNGGVAVPVPAVLSLLWLGAGALVMTRRRRIGQ